MIRIETATPEMFPRVFPLLETFKNPAITADHWRSLFEYTWPCEDPQRGFVLTDDDRVVGFFGTILSERDIGGRVERFANLTSWVTFPEYRHHSLRLFQAVNSIKDRTVTCFSPRNELLTLYTRSGFRPLGNGLVVLYPVPGLKSTAGWFSVRVTSDLRKIGERLEGKDAAIFAHHRAFSCQHLLASCGGQDCYVLFSRRKGRRFWFAYVHYVSDREFFKSHIDRLRIPLAIAARAPFVMLNEHLAPDCPLAWSRRTTLSYTPVFRSGTVAADAIDDLYAEPVLLGF